MRVDEFNRLADDEARRRVDACLGVDRWVGEVVSARPYLDVAALLEQARASAENLTNDELDAALGRHPRVGERSTAGQQEAEYSATEQSGVDVADVDATSLRNANTRYEERFGRVFLIRAAGRNADEIVFELERRLDNSDDAERREVVTELRQIALLRLEQAVQP